MAAADHSVLKTIFDHFQEWTKAEIKQRVPQKLPFSSLYFTLYSSSLLFLLILYTGFLEDKPPISCQTNHDFDLDETSFFNKICFFNGTFVLQNAFTSEQVKENLGYYRHVLPIIVFLFFFCGFSIFINHLVLEYQRTKLLGFPPSRKTSTAKRIKCACCQIKKAKGDRFWRTTQLVFMYLLSDISPLIWSVASFHLTDLYLEGQFKSYGLNMLLYILFRVPNDHLRSLFPLRSTCEHYEYGSSGTLIRMSGDCLLTFNNYFHPGLFAYFWFVHVSSLIAFSVRFLVKLTRLVLRCAVKDGFGHQLSTSQFIMLSWSKKVNSDVFKWLHKMLRPSNSKLIKWMTDSKLEKLDSKFSSFPYKLEEIEEQFTKVKLE